MYCPNCRKGNIEENARFCPFCGTSLYRQTNEKPKEATADTSKGSSILSILLCILIVVLSGILYWRTMPEMGSLNTERWTSDGFDTPEALLEQFGQYMAEGNMEGMLSLFGTSRMSGRYTMEDLKNRTVNFFLWHPSYFTPHGEIYKYLSAQKMYSWNVSEIRIFALALETEKDAMSSDGENFATQEAGKKWMDTLILDELDTFKIIRTDQITRDEESKQYESEYYRENYKSDDYQYVGILCEYAGSTYGCVVTTVKYDDKWYLQNLRGDLIYRSVLEQMNLDEYESLLRELND